MSEFTPVYIYLSLVAVVVLTLLALTALSPRKTMSAAALLPYESGIQTQGQLLQKGIMVRHYLVALIFLVFDVEVVFIYPWAVAAQGLGPFAFYEMLAFLIAMAVGFTYIWRKGGLQWE